LLAILPKPVPIARLLDLLRGARRNALVALVEDDSALADNLAEALRDRGFSAVMVHSVGDTLRLGGVKPFAALVDIRVKGGADGEAIRVLLRQTPGLPVLAMTAFAEAQGAATDSRRIFEKPFSTAEVLRAIEDLHEAGR
jgi:DNA-binding response OmpR family regulator